MRIFLLLLAVLFSLGILLLALLFAANKLSKLRYTLSSSAISILAVFALFHFIYLYWNKGRRQKN